MTAPIFEAADNRLIRPRRYLQEVLEHRTFLAYWVRRNILARYRQTTLGPIWALLLPLLSGLVYAFVFKILLGVDTGRVPYALFTITNLMLWIYTTRAILTGPSTLLGNLDVITRVRFPREVLLLGVWLESLTDLALSVVIVTLFFAYYHVAPTPYLLMAIVVFLVYTALTLGCMFLVAAISISVRDLAHIMPVLLQLLLYLAPVIYPVSIVPLPYRALYLANPFATVFAAFEETLFLGRFTLGSELAVAAVVSLVLLVVGYRLLKREEWKLADLL